MCSWTRRGCTSHMHTLRGFQLFVTTLANTEKALLEILATNNHLCTPNNGRERLAMLQSTFFLQVPLSACMRETLA